MKTQTRKQRIKSYAKTLDNNTRKAHTQTVVASNRMTIGRFATHAKINRRAVYHEINATHPRITAIIAPETGKLQVVLDKKTLAYVEGRGKR